MSHDTRWQVAQNRGRYHVLGFWSRPKRGLAGAAGFEPAMTESKSVALTSWPRPSNARPEYRAMAAPMQRQRAHCGIFPHAGAPRSEEHTSELQSLMRISYAVFCLKKKKHIMCSQHKILTHTA